MENSPEPQQKKSQDPATLGPAPLSLSYETPDHFRAARAPQLLRLAGTFNTVLGSLDVLGCLANAGVQVVTMTISHRRAIPVGTSAWWLNLAMTLALLGLSAINGAFELFAGVALLQKWRGFWTIALAAAIVELIPCLKSCCFLNFACGLYTLIILCLPEVRAFSVPSPRGFDVDISH